MNKETKRVLICCPIGGQKQYSIVDWFDWIVSQNYSNYEIAVCVNGEGKDELAKKFQQTELRDVHGNEKKIAVLGLNDEGRKYTVIQRLTFSREILRQFAIEKGFDYLLFLDSDTIPLTMDAIERLISWEKEAVSGVYFYKFSSQPVVIDRDTATNISLEKLKEGYEGNKLTEVWGFGFGILLLDVKALTDCAFDYKVFGEERSDDFGYCHVLENKGIKRWCDARVICKHLSDESKPNLKNITPIDFNDKMHYINDDVKGGVEKLN